MSVSERREQTDALGAELAAARRWFADNGLKDVPAWIKGGTRTVTVRWNPMTDDGAPGWPDFLGQAKALRAPFVAIRVERLTQEEWDEELQLALEDDEGSEPATTPPWLEACRPHIGLVGMIELKWFAPEYPGVVFAWSMLAPWFELFSGRGETDESTVEPQLIGHEFSRSEVRELAAKVAHSPEYERATEHHQREEIVRRLLPPDATRDDRELYRVMNAATDIFDAEIVPALEKSADVRELAIKLANDARFQRATNQQARRYAAEQILPVEVVAHGIKFKLILDRAKAIYYVDLRKGNRPRH